jgi:D-serine deaminase-like pyridoxal phosphate-dependent protein
VSRILRALADVRAPAAYVDVDAFDANADILAGQAGGIPIRLATKSVRARGMIERALAHPAFRGLMTFTVAESVWLHGHGYRDLLCAYPQTEGLDDLPEDGPILMVDSEEHLELIAARTSTTVRVCIEINLNLGPIGVRRSSVRTKRALRELGDAIRRHPRLELAGVMGYEAHLAGVGDEPFVIHAMQKLARPVAARRRARLVRSLGPLAIVNGGGTGSLAFTSAERGVVTELTAGSGLFASHLFDRYRHLHLTPAAGFMLPVSRKPDAKTATLLGGGYIASGAAGSDRLPIVDHPPGLKLTKLEGAGEVQTPVVGDAAAALHVGDRVLLRHAKAGELCERFNSLHLIQGDRVVDEVPTYRGEGQAFL